MKKRVLMHVGLGQTGARVLQETLAHNRPALGELDAAYPGGVDAHHDLIGHLHTKGPRHAWYAGRGLGVDAAQDLMERQMSALRATAATNVPVILLSSEHFQTLRADDLIRFDQQMDALGYQLETLCTVRAPLAHTAARIHQGVLQGSARIAQMMDRPYPPLARDHLSAALKALGAERVHLRRVEDAPSGLARAMLDVAGLTPAEGTFEDQPSRPSLCHDAVYLLDAINAQDAFEGPERPTYRAHAAELFAMPGLPFALPPEVAKRIQTQARAEQDWLFRHFKTCYPTEDLKDVPTHWQEIEWAADALAEVTRIDRAAQDWPQQPQAISA